MARIMSYAEFRATDLDFNNILRAQDVEMTASKVEITYGPGNWDIYSGSGFIFTNDGKPTAGTVNSLTREGTFGIEYKISGVAISLVDIYNASLTPSDSDDVQLLRVALSGNDSLIGSSLSDTFSGYNGNDLIFGRGGKDALSGGAGRDTFRFDAISDSRVSSRDTIKDFVRGSDKIDLSRIDADQDNTAGNQRFKFIGAKDFSGTDGELRFSGGTVYGDVNGDAIADFAIKVSGIRSLSASDFVL